MTSNKTRFFTLVDEYARERHRCFLAEMDLRTEETGYYLCFRPLNVSIDSPERYACRYLVATVEQVRTAVEMGALPATLIEILDPELSVLGQSV
jgi:hypothetical protein